MTNPQKIRCAALLYHHVGPLTAGMYPKMSIEPRQFERQVGWLKRRGYASILPSDWLTWHSGTAVLPEKPVMITFDDAYADIAEYALPVLKHYGFTATIFVVTERVGATNSWDTQNGYASLPLMTK
ncbi:MAG TPA: polysaccharide deacetylase family protein, partial [Terracidiphilus sp.]|nr:polysaccharide deacetylase family protein [Terracidiphilus sp.]